MTTYIDDSGTSPENAVAVAAGWIAHTDSWQIFKPIGTRRAILTGTNLIRCTWLNLCLVERGRNSKDGLLRKNNESQLGSGALSRKRWRRDTAQEEPQVIQ